MKLSEVVTDILNPALAWLPPKMDSIEARVQMLATGSQESKFEHRYQVLNDPTQKGPARSFWQMERGGGVKGVMTHSASHDLALAACQKQGVQFDTRSVWLAIEIDDFLAGVFARLLYWTDPGKLPAVTDAAGGWALYMRIWRPGKPHPETWANYHDAARKALGR